MGNKLHSPSCPPGLHGSVAGSLSFPDLYTLQRPTPQTSNVFSSSFLVTLVLLIPLNTIYTPMTPKFCTPAGLCPLFQTPLSTWMAKLSTWLANRLLRQASPQQSLVLHLTGLPNFLHLPIVSVLKPSTMGFPSLSSLFFEPAAHPPSSPRLPPPQLLLWSKPRLSLTWIIGMASGHLYPFSPFSAWQPEC